MSASIHVSRQEDLAFQRELTQWLDAHWPPFRDRLAAERRDVRAWLAVLKEWSRTLHEGRWSVIHWPERFGGRDATSAQSLIFDLEMQRRRIPPGTGAMAVMNVGPALIHHGTAAQQEAFLAPIARGDWIFCQGFSEPGAGSDLASLRTRAERVEGGYRINGQKIWTSNAIFADRMWLLARTNVEARKHRGVSAFIVDMRSAGIEVRPIVQLTGERLSEMVYNQQYNEVFFTDVFVPEFNRIGEENAGWTLARMTLVQERTARHSLALAEKTYRAMLGFRDDPQVRALYDGDLDWMDERLLDLRLRMDGMEAIYERSVRMLMAGQRLGAESSLIKLLSSEARQSAAELAVEVLGPYGIPGPRSPEAFKRGNAAFEMMRSRPSTIGGGTSDIQRNWIAERILGLPKAG
jgi:alkylation response protein AidB-like acyl-CoA dehydrogenase